MRKTKLLALLLVVSIVASMFVPSVAAEEPYTISIVDSTGASTINANAGDSVTLSLVIANNPGVSSIGIDIKRPEGWTTARPSNKNLFSDTAEAVATFSQTPGANPYYVSWLMATGTFENEDAGTVDMGLNKENGTLATVKITIPADAATGTYTIDLSIDGREKNNFYYNVDGNGVIVPDSGNTLLTPVLEDLTINVQGAKPAGEACPEHPETTTWTDVAAADWAAGGAIASGHYKLTEDIATTAALTVAEGETVCIDLAGFDITAGASQTTPYRVIESSGVLTILDTAETDGVISGGYMYGKPDDEVYIYGGNILVTGSSAVMNLYGGIVADGYMYAGSYKYHIYGGNIGLTEGATLNVKGGVISGGQVIMPQQATSYHGGGNIYAKDSTVNISAGVITDGLVKAHYSSSSTANRKAYGVGGNIVSNGGTLTISGGTISDGTVDVKCTATCTTATPSSTAEGLGGNINASGGAQVTITGGTISGGSVTALPVANNGGSTGMEAFGGNIYVTGTGTVLNMSGGTVSGGFAKYRGGNLTVRSAAVANLSGTAVIKGGYLSNYSTACDGDNIAVIGNNSLLNLYDGAQVLVGDVAEDYVKNSAIYNITNGSTKVYGGTVDDIIWVAGTTSYPNATFALYGGTIKDVYKSDVVPVENVVAYNGVVTGGWNDDATVAACACLLKNADGSSTIWHTAANDGTCSVCAHTYTNPETGKHTYVAGETAGTVVCSGCGDTKEGIVALLNGDAYTDLSDALDVAVSGDTVTLAADATENAVTVPVGVTLDLNGKNLTADEVTSAFDDTHIVDNVGTGKLTATSVSFAAANNQLPIYNDGAYTFEEVAIKEKYEEVGTKAIYKFYVNSEAAQTLLDDAILAGNDVAINVRVTWNDAAGNFNDKTVTLHADLLALYAGSWDTKMVILTINDISGVTNVDCTAQVVSNGVVEA